MLLRKIGVNRGQKQQLTVQILQERRLAGSLPARIELLVLTCTIHTPERNTRGMRATVKSGVIEHLHTLYSHLSIHAKPSAEDAGAIYLLSFVCVFDFMVS